MEETNNEMDTTMIDSITSKDWEDFWYSSEKSTEWNTTFDESISALSRRKMRLLIEIEEINLQISHLNELDFLMREQNDNIHKKTKI